MEKISLKSFLDLFCNNVNQNKKYCFILGAGASKSSGIPTGAELAIKWRKELDDRYEQDEIKQWINDFEIDEENLPQYYPQIYDKRFHLDPDEGFAELEGLMENITPSCGYSFLSQILTEKGHNIVITTNFDSLTEDALFIYSQKKPLIVGHESLAGFIRHRNQRPIIVKIHRDLFLGPKNSLLETSELPPKLKEKLTKLLEDTTPLVIGYGGNDGSLMGFLEELKEIKGGIFWFYCEKDGEPNERIQELVKNSKGFGVPIPDFDGLMIQIGTKLGLKPLDKKIVRIAENRAKTYREQIEQVTKTKTKETKKAVKDFVSRASDDWWFYELLAMQEKDPNKKQKIYEEGIKILPDSSELFNIYADFLYEDLNNYNKAEKLYKNAIKFNPHNDNAFINYAVFLIKIRKDYDKAEEFLKKAIKINPLNDKALTNYAMFLKKIRENYNKADELYKKAIEYNPQNVNAITNYAIFLDEIKKDFGKAEEFYKKAIKINPKNDNAIVNYAIFLNEIKKDHDKAEEFYKKAIKINPQNDNALANYALFLNNIRKNYDKAEEFYKRTIKINPQHVKAIINYSNLLCDIRRNYDKAEEFYKKAIKINSQDDNTLAMYATFLENIRKNYDKAEEFYKKAIEINPLNDNVIALYAIFLDYIRNDYNKAEQLYQKAIGINPQNDHTLANYALFLEDIKKNYNKADELYKKVIEINPNNIKVMARYASFLTFVKKEYDKANEIYSNIINKSHNNEDILFQYVLFLTLIKKDYNKAEKLFLQLLEINPTSIGYLTNLAEFYIISKKLPKAKERITNAFQLNNGKEKDYDLILWFYRYAAFFDEYEQEAKQKIEEFLSENIRFPGWNLDEVCKTAKELNHPNYEQVEKFAKQITEEE